MTGVDRPASGLVMTAVLAGAALGVAYTLSPLTVLVLSIGPMVWKRVSGDLSDRERHWLSIVLVAAIAVRLVAIAGLFVTAPHSMPYATFFGDEDAFKRRSLWLRNIGLGIPISSADFLYAFDDVGRTAYLYVLAFVQAVVGDAPYGMLVLNAGIYLVGVLALYRLVRPAYGGLAALGGLTLLLFLPSLFAWSISALKEPPYICLGALEIVAAVVLLRGPGALRRVAAGIFIVACAIALQSLRQGGLFLTLFGVGGGLIAATIATRPRWLLAAVVVIPILTFAVVRAPAVQRRMPDVVYAITYKHWGQVVTPGYTYQLLDPQFYDLNRRAALRTLTVPQVARYVVRGVVAYVIVPAPWQIESTAALAYLPEQMVWYVLVLLAPIGAWAGFRRDPAVTTLLVCHVAIAALMVALTSGNVGTLVRHRGLALPFVAWLSALGAVHAGRWLLRHTSTRHSPVLATSRA